MTGPVACCRIEVEVGSMSEKKTLLQKVENLKQKRAWLVYSAMRSRLMEVVLRSKSHTKHQGVVLYIQKVLGSDLSSNTGPSDMFHVFLGANVGTGHKCLIPHPVVRLEASCGRPSSVFI